jgi:exonuclease III
LKIDTPLFFSHGAKSNNRTKEASESSYLHSRYRHDPIRPGKIAGATQVMSLELHFHDTANKINKLFAISTYLPCSSCKNNQYEATLAELDKILRKCSADASHTIIGGDFNASQVSKVTTPLLPQSSE